MSPKVVCRAGVALAVFLSAARFSLGADINTDALLKELDAIEAQQKEATTQRLGTLAKQFMDASNTAAATERLYTDALKKTGEKKPGDAGRDGRREHKDRMDDKAYVAALQLQLRYIALTLAAASDTDKPPPLKELVAYVKELETFQDKVKSIPDDNRRKLYTDLLNQLLWDSPFAKANFLESALQQFVGPEDSRTWEPTAGNWKNILNLDVRRPLRASKNPLLLDTWQVEIDIDRADLDGNSGDVANTNFTQVELPRLLWAQAQDMGALGQNDKAIAAMTNVIRTAPKHPDLLQWVRELRGLIEQQKKQKKSAPSPSASPQGDPFAPSAGKSP